MDPEEGVGHGLVGRMGWRTDKYSFGDRSIPSPPPVLVEAHSYHGCAFPSPLQGSPRQPSS